MTKLSEKSCVPCRGGVDPMKEGDYKPLLDQLQGWDVVDQHHLTKTYKFPDFAQALDFVNRVGRLAEEEDHHPDVYLTYGEARLDIWTHKIDGLTESDFVMAAKADEVK
ncbi:MAG: 4a-hydroxytetrahydrobiopterin dehydratase [Candidatus Eisenbacteria bacterium]|nr:4a-hydroxytetrahydrobiopterin dehydratase [Candidatus Eisenbacteria bacterium]